jgi:hypothetical protein
MVTILEADEIRKQGIELLQEISQLQLEVDSLESEDNFDINKMKAFTKTIARLEKKLAQK